MHHNNERQNRSERYRATDERQTEKRPRMKRRRYKLMRGTRALSILFTLITTFVASGVAIFAANTYYNLDTSEIVVEEVQRVTQAIRATSGIIIGGTDGQDPTAGATLEVASGDVLFSTSGTITQSGSGAVEFSGDVGIGGAAATYEFEVTDGDADSIVANFGGRVIGAEAVNSDEFITLSQVTSGSTTTDAFLQGGNSFGAEAILGTNDAYDLSFETGGTSRVTIGSAGGVTVLSGEDFTVTDGTSDFGGDVNLSSTTPKIAATAGSQLTIDGNGTGTIRLADSSTGNIEFFNANNFIDSSGNFTIGGNFTLSGTSITATGELTVTSGGGQNLILDSDSGTIRVGDNDILTSGDFNLTSGEIFREVQPIFGYDVPVRCSTSCEDPTYQTVSDTIESYEFPSAYTGTTRQHNFTIRYADDAASATNWRVWNETAGSATDTFTVPASPTSNLDGGTVYTTGDVTIPTNGDDWHLEVAVSTAGETIQVNQVFLGAYDSID